MPSILTIGQQNIDNSKDDLINKYSELVYNSNEINDTFDTMYEGFDYLVDPTDNIDSNFTTLNNKSENINKYQKKTNNTLQGMNDKLLVEKEQEKQCDKEYLEWKKTHNFNK